MTGWLDLPRVPEPEVMDDSGEVAAYAGGAATKYFRRIDDSFVEHALRLVAPLVAAGAPGKALDIGSGPGQILRKLAPHLPGWRFVGVDRSPTMIREARASNGTADSAAMQFFLADGCRLPFADGSFDLVMSNSVLHHLEEPGELLAEMERVAKPAGAILLRDLRRPSRLAFSMHVRWHGRAYRGLMYKLYCDSVRAAYTPDELAVMLRSAPISRVRIFRRGRTHLGLERGFERGFEPAAS